MAWFALIVAGALEIVWALALKYSQGFTRFWPSIITVLAVIFSFIFLGLSLKAVPFGTAYAVCGLASAPSEPLLLEWLCLENPLMGSASAA
jgi:multidrug transporter EmrE-like cation transporter